MMAANLSPFLDSPDGQKSTMPTHAMLEMGAALGHSLRRMCISAWLIPKALDGNDCMARRGCWSKVFMDLELCWGAAKVRNDDSTHNEWSHLNGCGIIKW